MRYGEGGWAGLWCEMMELDDGLCGQEYQRAQALDCDVSLFDFDLMRKEGELEVRAMLRLWL